MSMLTPAAGSVRSSFPATRYSSWQAALRDAIRDPAELGRLLALPSAWLDEATAGGRDFRLFVPRGFAARMQRGDPHDPLLRQVLPTAGELTVAPGESTDPVGDLAARLAPGLLKKYAGRALLVTTGACAVHCRYCFRRHFPYAESPPSPDTWEEALAAIGADPGIDEVILSGGDPLTLTDERLAPLAGRLEEIPHLTRLRLHTRLPVMIPERVTDELLDWLTDSRLIPIVVIHANHAAELDNQVAAALARLTAAGIPLLNQSVLLRGVNDTVPALKELSERLIALRVLPYYLHQLDPVAGTSHFHVPIGQGRQLISGLRQKLPGYAVPRYVQELEGEPHKTPLAQ